ncbi:hypothetical protein [Paenibacillus sp. DR312]|uniref:hypothetical protein n=1 Tax=Paenibacillus sp. DR312 TaxID=2871175 RepID=UPI0037C6631F
MEWALRSDVVESDATGKFCPEETVSEAQFLIMLLRTYKVDTNRTLTRRSTWLKVKI